ncbi:DUF4254 domain-containing protein [Kitasatospora sp. NPDC058170]|uniref:DUF4254 domain-containing protein n=1 Tax=Kitasatospora sp. NPDC058170 TaxID=3346364 RepID=UPI0036DE133D
MSDPILDAAGCVQLQARLTRNWNATAGPAQGPPESTCPLLAHVALNHWHNHRIWALEDQARRVDCDDSTIADVKRCIDRENQLRNDEIERIDDEIQRRILALPVSARPGAESFSETPGSILDRLSILSLRLHHMGAQATRHTAGGEHRERCRQKTEALHAQSDHLVQCLTTLVLRLGSGQARLYAMPHFKMYNDPALNPALRAATTGAEPA